MFRHSLAAITVLLMAFGSPVVLKGHQPIEGNGIYRPLNLLRQLKLGTAYFVNPSLPGEVEIYNAYKLGEVWKSENMKSGKLWLAVQIPDQPALTLTILCPLASEADSPPGSSTDNSPCLETYLGYSRDELYVLSPQTDSFSEAGQPVISWDPQERVDTRFIDPDLRSEN